MAIRDYDKIERPERAKSCGSCGSSKIGVGEARNIRDKPIYPFYCLDCDEVLTQYASRETRFSYGRKIGRILHRVQTVTEKKIANGSLDIQQMTHMLPCEFCGHSGATEVHHWAPRHLFGDECEDWPTAHLCQACHTRWHQVVTPNQSNAGKI